MGAMSKNSGFPYSPYIPNQGKAVGFIGFAQSDGHYVARTYNKISVTQDSVLNFVLHMASDKWLLNKLFDALVKHSSWDCFTEFASMEAENVEDEQFERRILVEPAILAFRPIEYVGGVGMLDTSSDKNDEDAWVVGKLNNYFIDDSIKMRDGTVGYIVSHDNQRIIVVKINNTSEGLHTEVLKKYGVHFEPPCDCTSCLDGEDFCISEAIKAAFPK